MVRPAFSHVIAFDDAPFDPRHRGDVTVVGVVYSDLRLEGVISGRVRRDGVNSTRVIRELIGRSRFRRHLDIVLLQGIALAGFNVVDIHELHAAFRIPVLTVARRKPDLGSIRRALIHRVPGGRRKWALIEKAGSMEAAAGVYVQRAGISLAQAARLVNRLAVHSKLPEPLRSAHLIAGGMTLGESRHRA